MKNTETTIESKIIESEYKKEDDVEIETVASIPQPNRIEKNTFKVKDIRREIEDLEKDIASNQARIDLLKKLLEDNKTAIKGAVSK